MSARRTLALAALILAGCATRRPIFTGVALVDLVIVATSAVAVEMRPTPLPPETLCRGEEVDPPHTCPGTNPPR